MTEQHPKCGTYIQLPPNIIQKYLDYRKFIISVWEKISQGTAGMKKFIKGTQLQDLILFDYKSKILQDSNITKDIVIECIIYLVIKYVFPYYRLKERYEELNIFFNQLGKEDFQKYESENGDKVKNLSHMIYKILNIFVYDLLHANVYYIHYNKIKSIVSAMSSIISNFCDKTDAELKLQLGENYVLAKHDMTNINMIERTILNALRNLKESDTIKDMFTGIYGLYVIRFFIMKYIPEQIGVRIKFGNIKTSTLIYNQLPMSKDPKFTFKNLIVVGLQRVQKYFGTYIVDFLDSQFGGLMHTFAQNYAGEDTIVGTYINKVIVECLMFVAYKDPLFWYRIKKKQYEIKSLPVVELDTKKYLTVKSLFKKFVGEANYTVIDKYVDALEFIRTIAVRKKYTPSLMINYLPHRRFVDSCYMESALPMEIFIAARKAYDIYDTGIPIKEFGDLINKLNFQNQTQRKPVLEKLHTNYNILLQPTSQTMTKSMKTRALNEIKTTLSKMMNPIIEIEKFAKQVRSENVYQESYLNITDVIKVVERIAEVSDYVKFERYKYKDHKVVNFTYNDLNDTINESFDPKEFPVLDGKNEVSSWITFMLSVEVIELSIVACKIFYYHQNTKSIFDDERLWYIKMFIDGLTHSQCVEVKKMVESRKLTKNTEVEKFLDTFVIDIIKDLHLKHHENLMYTKKDYTVDEKYGIQYSEYYLKKYIMSYILHNIYAHYYNLGQDDELQDIFEYKSEKIETGKELVSKFKMGNKNIKIYLATKESAYIFRDLAHLGLRQILFRLSPEVGDFSDILTSRSLTLDIPAYTYFVNEGEIQKHFANLYILTTESIAYIELAKQNFSSYFGGDIGFTGDEITRISIALTSIEKWMISFKTKSFIDNLDTSHIVDSKLGFTFAASYVNGILKKNIDDCARSLKALLKSIFQVNQLKLYPQELETHAYLYKYLFEPITFIHSSTFIFSEIDLIKILLGIDYKPVDALEQYYINDNKTKLEYEFELEKYKKKITVAEKSYNIMHCYGILNIKGTYDFGHRYFMELIEFLFPNMFEVSSSSNTKKKIEVITEKKIKEKISRKLYRYYTGKNTLIHNYYNGHLVNST